MSDEHKQSPETEELKGRRTFVKIGIGSIAIAACGTGLFGYQFMYPNVLYEPSPIVNAGKPDRYPADSVTLDPETGIYVVRSAEGFYALSAVCTHLGCLTAWKPELGIIACPCHGSKFQRTGTKIEGPAPKPLPWLRMWLNEDGDLLVDRSTPIPQNQMVRV
ncbi:MAG TPA: Rieske (2Fe-2S) protein [Terriglobales bacterium]